MASGYSTMLSTLRALACVDLDRWAVLDGVGVVRCLSCDVSPVLSGLERGEVVAVFGGYIVYYNRYDAHLQVRPYSDFSVDELVNLCEWIATHSKRTYTIPRAATLDDILADIAEDGK